MPRAEVGTPKYIANKMKAKGLQKLRWYCQMCQKQCRDENGFKCHTMSESHQRQLLLFADNQKKYMDEFSYEFQKEYLEILRRQYGTKRVLANRVYQEYISDRHHLHMNATRWLSLTGFVKWLGRAGKCVVDETEKGWFVTYIDRDPETIAKLERRSKKIKMDKDDEERMMEFVQKQVEIGKKVDSAGAEPVYTDFQRKSDDEKIVLKLDLAKSKKGLPAPLLPLNTLKRARLGEVGNEEDEEDTDGEGRIRQENSAESEGSDEESPAGESRSSGSSLEDGRSSKLDREEKSRRRRSSTSSLEEEEKSPRKSQKRKKENEDVEDESSGRDKSEHKKKPSIFEGIRAQKPKRHDDKSKSSSSNETPFQKRGRQEEKRGKEERPKPSALDEIMAAEETKRERENRKDYWLTEGIVVKVMTKSAGEDFYKKKGVVREVVNKYAAVVKMLDNGKKIKFDQAHLETVIPAMGRLVKVVNGAYRGNVAKLISLDERIYCVNVEISSGLLKGRKVEKVQYEDVCKLHVPDE